ncbi:MAG: NADPH:quinone reductase [Acidimicrobiales bacterium]
MRAAVYDRFGPAAAVLRTTELDRPEPGPGEVRVRVRLSAVNPTDYKARMDGPGKEMAFPFVVPHQDGAGEVDAVGPGVDPGRVGDRVWMWFAAFQRQLGTAAEWICLPSERAVALPEGASLDLGACLGVPAVTAQVALFSDGPLDGRTVLVAGGAGAVGHYAIQLARRGGARVLTTVSSPEKERLASEAGAHGVVDYRQPGAAEALRGMAPGGVDRVIELALGTNMETDLSLLVNGGTVVTYASDEADPAVPVRRLMMLNARLRFMILYNVAVPALLHAVTAVSEAVADGTLTELPTVRFPLEQVVAAHEAVEGHAVGKVLLDLG